MFRNNFFFQFQETVQKYAENLIIIHFVKFEAKSTAGFSLFFYRSDLLFATIKYLQGTMAI